VVYLIFNEGYAAHTGDALVRHELCQEAVRLGHLLVELMPHEPEVLGLLALMELQASRAATRTDADGNLVLLADQDRSRWDQARIATVSPVSIARGPWRAPGHTSSRPPSPPVTRARPRGRRRTAEDRRPLRELADVAPSPVVELNRAVAIGLAQGAAAGLAALDGIESAALRGYHLLPAARADFLRRLGRWTEAAASTASTQSRR